MSTDVVSEVARQRAADIANRQMLVQRAKELAPVFARNASQTEQDRRAAEENVQALQDAGIFKTMTPQRYGGFQGSVRTHLEVTAAVAESCGGTAWVVALTNVCNWFTGLMGQQAQDDVFGANPNARVAGVLTPSATLRRVEGGAILTGKWFWASGSLHADWAFVGAMEIDAQGNPVDQLMALAPMTEMSVADTWYTIGMRGSGSNCFVANEVFIPDHRLMSAGKAIAGDYPTPHKTEAAYRAALVPVFALVLIGAQLGMARAALRHVIEKAPQRNIAYTSYQKQTDSTAFQMQVARAAMMIDSAHLHAWRAAEDIDEAAYRGEYLDYVTRARTRADTGWVAKQITEALQILITAHGAGTFAESNVLQRIWRDSNTAARHAVVLQPVGEEVYGMALLGVENHVTPLV